MGHYSRLYKAVVDVPAADHDRELAFWQEATGQQFSRNEVHPEYHGAVLAGRDFGMLIQQLGGGDARVHLDVHTDDLEAEVARLERLGAERAEQVNSWWVMRDPAGIPFCVIPQSPGSLDDGNAQYWD